MANALRTKAMIERYAAYKATRPENDECALCVKPATQTFTYWKVTPNEFPYDLVAKTHDMIMPIRHAAEDELTPEEWAEFREIKAGFMQEYDNIIEGTHRTKSIPAHYHLHLIVGK